MDSPKRREQGAAVVVDYLKTHPDFFRDHPELLRELNIPHLPGTGVASLIERQVSMLRAQCSQLEQELEVRKTRAGLQREMLQNVQALTLRLIRCRDMGEACSAMVRLLRRDYAADEVRIFVFSDLPEPGPVNGVKFMPRNAKLKYMFIELLNRNRPLCGSLQDEHIRILFQGAAGHVSSTMIMPLRYERWEGLAAVGSQERGRYGRGFELEMLQHLFAVAGARFDQFLTRRAA
jgi:uncharacterized protein YigA (DUF484 family)